MPKFETTETVIIKVGFLGDVREGIGSSTFTIDSDMSFEEMLGIMGASFRSAISDAQAASVDIFRDHLEASLREKYGPEENDEE